MASISALRAGKSRRALLKQTSFGHGVQSTFARASCRSAMTRVGAIRPQIDIIGV
jgi:hypothetical protein